jgi:rod shape-determining protein MreB
VVVYESLRAGGDRMNDAIIAHARKKYSLLLGEITAEEIKKSIGTAMPPRVNDFMEVRGRNLKSGLPVTVNYTAMDTYEALHDILRKIIDCVRKLLEETPPELVGDILRRGIMLTGGGSLLRDIDLLLHKETGIPIVIAEHPLDCVALGAGKMLNCISTFCQVARS